ncbi:MAG: response regulator [Pseudomonadota bacterium]
MNQTETGVGAQLAAFREKDSPEGRFERYARARVRDFWLRQIMTVYGSVAVGLVVDPRIGLTLFCLAILGELIDCSVLIFLLRRGLKAFRRSYAKLMAAGAAGIQATAFSFCIGLAWVTGGPDLYIFCIAFFGAALLNAGIVANFQPQAAWVRIIIYTVSTFGLAMSDIFMSETPDTRWVMTTLAILMLATTIGLFLQFSIRLQSRYMAMTGELLAEQTQVEQALHAKTRFLSSVSHQLRTPLNGIMGASDMLAHKNPRKDQQDLLTPLRSSAADLNALINDILDVTQLEKGGLLIQRKPMDPYAAIHDVTSIYEHRALHKGLKFHYDVSPDMPKCVLADRDRIQQILSKLLSNAIAFTDSGEISVMVTNQLGQQSNLAFVTITDTGRGISKRQLGKIFRQGTHHADGMDSGLGLGLRIAKRLAMQMGGNLLIESAKGQGTTCHLTLELQPLTSKCATANAWEISKASILVAEDNKTNQLIVQKMLSPTGAALHFAKDGQEAVDQYHKLRPDIILMDLAMPKKTGIEATIDIRAYESRSKAPSTPIIALTANAFEEDQQSCVRAGMDGFLSKPVTRDALISEINRAGNTCFGDQPSSIF